MKVEYDSTNSGGYWWLSDQDWYELEKAGWKVSWIKDNPHFRSKRFLGALAMKATFEGIEGEILDLQKVVEEWEEITGEDAEEEGCYCCGKPHSFTLYDDKEIIQ
jgi:hypothetical protein